MLRHTYKDVSIMHALIGANFEKPLVKGYPLGETHSLIIAD